MLVLDGVRPVRARPNGGRALRRFFFKLNREQGQALVLFAAGLIGFLAIVGLSIDVGRLVWARTQMQAAVDASAIAAAGGMPSTTQATTNANKYWTDNSAFIRSNGTNVNFAVTFPPGSDEGVQIDASADVSTWFLKLVGINSWHVSGSGTAAAQNLDISVVMDISGSMCDDNYPETESPGTGVHMAPGRKALLPHLTAAVPAGGSGTITLTVDANISTLLSTSSSFNNTNFAFNQSTPNWRSTYYGQRPGMIMIDQEMFQITSVNAASKQLTVRRAQTNNFLGTPTVSAAHAVGAEIWSNHGSCYVSAYNTPTSVLGSGPEEREDTAIVDAQYFTTLFNSTYDQFGLSTFSSVANPRGASARQSLTSNYASVTSAMASIAYPDGGTNTAHGIAAGRMVLDGTGSRPGATRILVLLTDGRANSYCGSTYFASNYNSPTSCPSPGGGADGNPSAFNAAIAETRRLANDNNTTFYVIGLGTQVDDAFLGQIADGGVAGVGPCQQSLPNCNYFKAPSKAQLQAAFIAVAQAAHIQLIK